MFPYKNSFLTRRCAALPHFWPTRRSSHVIQRDTGCRVDYWSLIAVGAANFALVTSAQAVKFLLCYVMTHCTVELERPSDFANPNASASVAHAERHVSFEIRLVKMLQEGIEKYDLE